MGVFFICIFFLPLVSLPYVFIYLFIFLSEIDEVIVMDVTLF